MQCIHYRIRFKKIQHFAGLAMLKIEECLYSKLNNKYFSGGSSTQYLKCPNNNTCPIKQKKSQ